MSHDTKRDDTRACSTPEEDDDDQPRDWLCKRGAMALARRLARYWHNLGYPAARFWAEPIDERFAKVGTYEIYSVACNLVNGLPPRYADEFPKR